MNTGAGDVQKHLCPSDRAWTVGRTQQPRICPPPLECRLAGGRFERSPRIDRFDEACFSPAPLATATIEAAAPDTGLSPPSSRGHWLHSVQPCFSCYLLLIVDVILFCLPSLFPHSFSSSLSEKFPSFLRLTWSSVCVFSSPERPG